MHNRLELVLHRSGEFSCVHNTGKQDNLCCHSVRPELECLGNPRHGKRINVRQVLGDVHHAVPVRIRLDDGHDLAAWSGFANDLEIVFQRAEPDKRSCSKTH